MTTLAIVGSVAVIGLSVIAALILWAVRDLARRGTDLAASSSAMGYALVLSAKWAPAPQRPQQAAVQVPAIPLESVKESVKDKGTAAS